jgi:SOS-response transcriptional repressor LexA
VASYLFEDGRVRETLFDISPLRRLIEANSDDLVQYVAGAFTQGWPEADVEVVSLTNLARYVGEMVDDLAAVVARLRRRLLWAMEQIKRLNAVREQQGDLDPEDDALFKRCDRLVKRLKGTDRRSRREAEGYDDVHTFGMLAAEGFLPGYGLELGSILGFAEIPFWRAGAMDFVLPRPPSVALREYVPGNLIYANGNRFVARRFHRDVDEQRAEMPVFEVSTERQAIKQTDRTATSSSLGSSVLQAISVCDVDLVHQSHISDDEVLRFQLGVAVHGVKRDQHNGGTAYRWGAQPVHHVLGDRMRLVNVGAANAIARKDPYLGYPVCTVCGQSVSPLSNDHQLEKFATDHAERCGRQVQPVGFYADVVADTLILPALADQTTAYSMLEALRMGAAQVIDMHVDDLQVLVIGHIDRDEVDAVLWDPMPGGSGLIEQMLARFDDVLRAVRAIVAECPSACAASCIDCLQTFRNGYYHKYLDRNAVLDCLENWGGTLSFAHDIPPKQPSPEPSEGSYPVNEAERRLRALLLAAGFGEGERGVQLRLDPAIGTTTPDVIYRAPHHDEDEGIAIYLDGMSAHIHGNPVTAAKDREIRDWLRNHGWEVIEIAVNQLSDADAMERHFRRLAGYLADRELRDAIRADRSWFERAAEGAERAVRAALRLVKPTSDQRWVTAVPLVPLSAAAGAFSEAQHVGDEHEWDWVELETARQLRRGMFVAQVVGRSMEPLIPDGSYCLFSSPVTGSRQGRIVLVELRDAVDPESGDRYTVKRYESEKSGAEDGWRHQRITLRPENPEFDPIIIRTEDENDVAVVAEFVEVVGTGESLTSIDQAD